MDSRIPARKDFTPPLKLKGKIIRLLEAGLTVKQVANNLDKSYVSIYKRVKKYERERLIERACKYPALYHRRKKFLPQTSLVGDFTLSDLNLNEPLVFPIKFGASFKQFGRPNLKYNRNGIATKLEVSHTIRFGKRKAVIWLKNIYGITVNEILINGENAIRDLANYYENKYNIKLVFEKIYPDIEWGVTSKSISKKTAKKAGIEKGGSKIVAGAIHKFKDSSHPENMQFNALSGGEQYKPTEHSKIHEYLYSRLPDDLERIGKTMDKISDSITVIDQKVEVLSKKKFL